MIEGARITAAGPWYVNEWTPVRRRPSWWWLALVPASLLAWVIYRATVGWPVGRSLLERLAG